MYSIEESAQKDQLESFLKSSTAFYLSLVESIEEKYGFEVATVLAGKADFNSKTHLRTVSSSIIVKLGIMVYLCHGHLHVVSILLNCTLYACPTFSDQCSW